MPEEGIIGPELAAKIAELQRLDEIDRQNAGDQPYWQSSVPLGPYQPLSREEVSNLPAPYADSVLGRVGDLTYAPARIEGGGVGQVPIAGPSWVRAALHELNPPRMEPSPLDPRLMVDTANSQQHQEFKVKRFGPKARLSLYPPDEAPRMRLSNEDIESVESMVAERKRRLAEDIPYERAVRANSAAKALARERENAALYETFGSPEERARTILALTDLGR